MWEEILNNLNLQNTKILVDATLGLGGYAAKILERNIFNGKYIGIDKDEESLKLSKQRLSVFQKDIEFIHQDFRNLDVALKSSGIDRVDGFIFDLGVSMYQLTFSERGFSFLKEGPLDMRMDRYSSLSAYDLVNNLSEKELSYILREFGQERFHKRIAQKIVMQRKLNPISTTCQLTDIITSSLPSYIKTKAIHPATRSFQALRIAVNNELEVLKEGLDKAIGFLNAGGRICVISFHSLEDRIVKQCFVKAKNEGVLKLITPKPLICSEFERKLNIHSRSAKLRVAEKI